MTCHHKPGDPNCSSHPDNVYARQQEYEEEQRKKKQAEIDAVTPNPDSYEIFQIERVGPHLVLKVKYPNCIRCAYEGVKIMVFLNVKEFEAMKWRRIDPHFRDPKSARPNEAPSPAARFPGSSEGWSDALEYARSKVMKTGHGG